MNDLIGTADIANMLRLTRDYVTDRLTKKPGFPKPRVAISQKTRLWSRSDIEKWMAPQESRNAG
jgi:predicted DNA-binding transcriptional regulator AlpA